MEQSGACDTTQANHKVVLRVTRMVETTRKALWIEPEIRDLDVEETNAQPTFGADVGGSPFPDCQAS